VSRNTGQGITRRTLAGKVHAGAAAKRSKFGVRTDVVGKLRRTLDGIVYHSAFERDYAAILTLDLKTKLIKKWERQVRIPLVVNHAVVCEMIVDFRVTHLDGSEELIETKGAETDIWKLKYALFRALHPGVKYTIEKRRGVR
jgi:hypothetical protein